jgi:hypothetical protein
LSSDNVPGLRETATMRAIRRRRERFFAEQQAKKERAAQRRREKRSRRAARRMRRVVQKRNLKAQSQIIPNAELPEGAESPDSKPVQTGVTALIRERYNLLPELVRADFEQLIADVTSDLGGAEQLSAIKKRYITRLAQLDTILSLTMGDMAIRGMLTPQGKMRSTAEAFFKAIDRFDKIARQLGIERLSKKINQTIEDYLSAQPDAHEESEENS